MQKNDIYKKISKFESNFPYFWIVFRFDMKNQGI